MGSKIFLLLGLSISFALLLSSEVAARDLAETTTKTKGVGSSSEGGGHYNGGGVSGRHSNFKARAAGEVPPATYEPPCNYYCYGMCCSAAEAKALEARTQVKTHN